MPNDSTTPGLITPTSTAPVSDDALDDILHDLVVGITGLPPGKVRPRWQPQDKMLDEPSAYVDWCAVGVTESRPDANPVIVHNSDGDGSSTLYRNYELTVIASFYGPAGQHIRPCSRTASISARIMLGCANTTWA